VSSIKWIGWKVALGLGFLALAIMAVVGLWANASWWRWDIFVGGLAIALSVLFSALASNLQMRTARRQSVFGGYGLILAMCKLFDKPNLPPKEWIDLLWEASQSLDALEKESKDKMDSVLG